MRDRNFNDRFSFFFFKNVFKTKNIEATILQFFSSRRESKLTDHRGSAFRARARGLPSVKTKTDLSKSGFASCGRFRRLDIRVVAEKLSPRRARPRTYGDSEKKLSTRSPSASDRNRSRRCDVAGVILILFFASPYRRSRMLVVSKRSNRTWQPSRTLRDIKWCEKNKQTRVESYNSM